MDSKFFNDRIRQILLLVLVITIGCLLITQLATFIPGILGGITLYILSRSTFFSLIYKRRWKKGWTALLFIFCFIILIAIPIYFSITLVSPKISSLFNNQAQVMQDLRAFSERIRTATGIQLLSESTTQDLSKKISSFIPSILNSTANILTNLLMMFFLLYYLLVNGKEVEARLRNMIPLRKENINSLATESKMMIKGNALGIPIICIIQGIVATIGYYLFGVKDWGLWGFVTGVFAFFPIVGTMIVWVPIVIMLFTGGQNATAIYLTLYSVVVTGNVDYLARITLLKKMGNVHPMITVLGVIAGLNLFGFVGLIFGPLLVSYFLVLVKIYINEFSETEKIQSDITPEDELKK